MTQIQEIVVPEWYRKAREEGLAPEALKAGIRKFLADAMTRRQLTGDVDEDTVMLTYDMYESVLEASSD